MMGGGGSSDRLRYYAHISTPGPIRRGMVPGSIGVLESPDRFMPIGLAHCFAWDGNGLALWHLSVRGQELPGAWVIIDREFRPVP